MFKVLIHPDISTLAYLLHTKINLFTWYQSNGYNHNVMIAVIPMDCKNLGNSTCKKIKLKVFKNNNEINK